MQLLSNPQKTNALSVVNNEGRTVIMTHADYAFALGVEAFKAGTVRAPALDKRLGPFLTPLVEDFADSLRTNRLTALSTVGNSVAIQAMKSWLKGWDSEMLRDARSRI